MGEYQAVNVFSRRSLALALIVSNQGIPGTLLKAVAVKVST